MTLQEPSDPNRSVILWPGNLLAKRGCRRSGKALTLSGGLNLPPSSPAAAWLLLSFSVLLPSARHLLPGPNPQVFGSASHRAATCRQLKCMAWPSLELVGWRQQLFAVFTCCD